MQVQCRKSVSVEEHGQQVDQGAIGGCEERRSEMGPRERFPACEKIFNEGQLATKKKLKKKKKIYVFEGDLQYNLKFYSLQLRMQSCKYFGS